jgi:hypothetical protein
MTAVQMKLVRVFGSIHLPLLKDQQNRREFFAEVILGPIYLPLPRRPWGLFLMAPTSSPKTMSERISFEQPWCVQI